MPFKENDAVIPRTRARLSHWSPWPRKTRRTFGPKTSRMVVVVDNCVRTNPKKYLTSGPARGNMHKLDERNGFICEISPFSRNQSALTEKQSSKYWRRRYCKWHTISFVLHCTMILRFSRCSTHGCPRREKAFRQSPNYDPTNYKCIVWISSRWHRWSDSEIAERKKGVRYFLHTHKNHNWYVNEGCLTCRSHTLTSVTESSVIVPPQFTIDIPLQRRVSLTTSMFLNK